MKTLMINASTSYPIYIGADLLRTTLLKDCCVALGKRVVIITDSHLEHTIARNIQTILQQQGSAAELFTMPAGEYYKTRETKQQLEDQLLAKQYGRDTCIIAVGGGVVTDLVGFLAATYCRGVPVIYVPTTLLAMVDASIGGKTGINTPLGKNLIGSFKQPHAVIIDTSTLQSLPPHEFANGMSEVIKHGLIADPEMLVSLNNADIRNNTPLLADIIYGSCVIKKNIVEQDETETGSRQLLNFGHTIGHAIERLENYTISHGEAVAIGILVESYLSVLCGYLDAAVLPTIEQLLTTHGLPLKKVAFQDINAFKQALLLDKKTIKHIPRFVLLDSLGKARYGQVVTEQQLNQALMWAQRFTSNDSLLRNFPPSCPSPARGEGTLHQDCITPPGKPLLSLQERTGYGGIKDEILISTSLPPAGEGQDGGDPC